MFEWFTEVNSLERLLLYELRTDRLESIIGTNPHWLFRSLLRFQEAHDTRGGNESPTSVVPSRPVLLRAGRLTKLQPTRIRPTQRVKKSNLFP